MKVRIKYTKSGSMKFIGHLDVMRYFQKAVKRAGFDIAYSKGFSPHQLMSFAAPLALGVTSEGEYFEAEFNTLVSSEEFVKRFNEQMVDGMKVNDVVLLPENAKKAMSIVAASDYIISLKDDLSGEQIKTLQEQLDDAADVLLENPSIEVFRKTKKQEKIEDIKPGIYQLSVKPEGIYMLLATGSEYNLKPDSVMEAIYRQAGIPHNKFHYQIHRIETYMKNQEGRLVSLLEGGTHIE